MSPMGKPDFQPPLPAVRLVQRRLPAKPAHGLLGDLCQEAHELMTSGHSRRGASIWFWRQAILLCLRYRLHGIGPQSPFPRPNQARAAHPNRGDHPMSFIRDDLAFAFRGLLKSPGFSAVAALTLSLGIGAPTAIFSVVQGVLLSPLQSGGSQRTVIGYGQNSSNAWARVSPLDFLDYRSEASEFEAFSAYSQTSANLTGPGDPERLAAAQVSAGFFASLGTELSLGRDFALDDEQPGRAPIAVISYGLWQSRFGGDLDVLGKDVQLDGGRRTIVGVAPSRFDYPRGCQVWMPMVFDDAAPVPRRFHFLLVLGLLREGVGLDRVQAGMDVVARNLEAQFPQSNSGWKLRLMPLKEAVVSGVRPALLTLMAASAFVLLIACANVASLFMARTAGRTRELAVRSVLGATRLRLARQLLAEAVLLASAGGLGGVLLAASGVKLLQAFGERSIPRLESVAVDLPAVTFCLAVCLLTSLGFGLAPAWRSSARVASPQALRAGRRSTAGLRPQRFRQTLAACQIALALTLAVGSGLLIRSFQQLTQVDPGFHREDVLTLRLDLSSTRYRQESQVNLFYQQLLERLEAMPAVESAGLVDRLPIAQPGSDTGFTIEGRPAPPPDRPWHALSRRVMGGYFETMGIPILRGRAFGPQDHASAPKTVIIGEALADLHFADLDPIGQRLVIDLGQPYVAEIVGVAAAVRQFSLSSPAWGAYYLPASQSPSRSMTAALRLRESPAAAASKLRGIVADIDPQEPVSRIETMQSIVSTSLSQPRFSTLLLAVFSLSALTLALVGLYGVLAYLVSERIQEMGIRMALGAARRDVGRLVLKRGLKLTLAGIGVGAIGSLGVSRLLSSQLFGVSPSDPSTLLGVTFLVASAAMLACLTPAMRASRLDPIAILRRD